MTKKAKFYKKLNDKNLECTLCPHNCKIKNTNTGLCGIRKNIDGELYAIGYNKISTYNVDPIEKKPLYHFYPDSKIFSIGGLGCNLKCKFCQNFSISQTQANEYMLNFSSKELINNIKKHNCIGAAYTYNEPLINYEYILDCSRAVREAGYKNVLVSNGYINEKPLLELSNFVDAANIDLKSWDENFYKNICAGSLEPVKETIKKLYEKGVHVEITNLVIPNHNDDLFKITEMVKWIKNIDKKIPVHFSKFFPYYKMTEPPSTSDSLLLKILDIAKTYLDNVYLGNVGFAQKTVCHNCGAVLINRIAYKIEIKNLDKNKCKACGEKINIITN